VTEFSGVWAYTPKKGTVQRTVEKAYVFSNQAAALDALLRLSEKDRLELAVGHDIHYAYAQHRGVGYPAREEYFVVAPTRVEDKTRYGIDNFNRQ
jgi:hypothetical protein